MRKILVVFICLVLFLVGLGFGLWILALPENLVRDIASKPWGKGDFYFEAEGFQKGRFFNLSADRLFLRKKGMDKSDSLLIIDRPDVWLSPTSLLKLNPEVEFSGRMSNGTVAGAVSLAGGRTLRISGKDIQIRGVPFFAANGIRGQGMLSGDLSLVDGAGEGKFSLTDARLEGAQLKGFFLPLDIFQTARGLFVVGRDTIDVQSLTLEGQGVSARAKGSVRGKSVDMNVELMRDSSLRLDPGVAKTLEQYQVSPGYYRIPVKQNLP